MTPTQRRKKIRAFKEKKRKTGVSLKRFLIPTILLVGIFFYICATGRLTAGNQKITVVVNHLSGVYISTFDRKSGTITNLTVPAGTQVNVARQLGTWRAESVWKLGENEGLPGVLLSETILKNFKIPVNAWADSAFYGISEGGFGAVLRGLMPYKTNLGMGDKVKLALFSFGVPPGKRVNIDLADKNFLRRTKLVGGEEGYTISENFPQSLYYIFSDSRINSANLRIEIQNFSGASRGAETVAAVLEVLGGKAAAITKKPGEDFFCEVSGRDKEITRRVAEIFECKIASHKESDNFDLTIKVGEEFAKRY